MFPRILRYFEEGVPLTQPFSSRGGFSSIIKASVRRMRSSQKSTESVSGFSQEESGVAKASSTQVLEGGVDEKRNSQVSFAERIADDAEIHALEINVENGGNKDEEKEEESMNEDMIEEDVDEVGQGEGESDAIDELERIVEA
jgi:hypothetical protein